MFSKFYQLIFRKFDLGVFPIILSKFNIVSSLLLHIVHFWL